MDLAALNDFNLVAACEGLGRASRASGRPKTTLARHVASLEVSLGVRLFERGARAWRLTDEGRTLHTRSEDLLADLNHLGETLTAGIARPRGKLRISASVVFAHVALGRLVASFADAYPEVELDITGEDRFVDPAEDGYDVILRVNPSPDDRLVGRCIIRDDTLLVASPAFSQPAAAEVAALMREMTVSKTSSGYVWRVSDEAGHLVRPKPVMRLSSLLMVRDAILAGAGVALLPRLVVTEDMAAGRLRLWGVAQITPAEIWALHSSTRLVNAKTRAFLAFLSDAFPNGVFRPPDAIYNPSSVSPDSGLAGAEAQVASLGVAQDLTSTAGFTPYAAPSHQILV